MKREDIVDPILRAENLERQVSSPAGLLTILQGVNLAVHPGESVAVVGVSGSGKSTLLGLLAGLDLPSAGEVWLNGHALSQLDEDGRAVLRARLVGFVFQFFHLLPGLSAIENVMLPLELAGIRSARAAALEILEAVGLAPRAAHYPRTLSGGEQQRVAIARAFAANPSILFADEPTGNLDIRTGRHIIEVLFRLNETHRTTLVMVTHDEALASHCDRVLALVDGHLEPAT